MSAAARSCRRASGPAARDRAAGRLSDTVDPDARRRRRALDFLEAQGHWPPPAPRWHSVSPSQASRAATVAGATWSPSFDRRQRMSWAVSAHSSRSDSRSRPRRDHRRDGDRDRSCRGRRPAGGRSGCHRRARSGAPDAAGSQGQRAGRRARKRVEIGIRNIAAGQGRRMGPGRRLGEMRLQLLQRMLGQLAIGRDLAAEDRQQRGASVGSSSSST